MYPFYVYAAAQDTFWAVFSRAPLRFASDYLADLQSSLSRMDQREHRSAPVRPTDIGHRERCEPALKETNLGPQCLDGEPLHVFNPGPRWLALDFVHERSTLKYKLLLPSAYNGDPLPLIVMLHGALQDSDDFAAGTEMNVAAERHGLVVVYPEQDKIANPQRCWNWFRPRDQARGSGETGMLAALTSTVQRTFNLDASRTYVAGMSAGGAMAVNLAVQHPDVFAAAGIHSGLAFGVADDVISALSAMSDGKGKVSLPLTDGGAARCCAVPLIVFHGSVDNIVHPSNGDQVLSLLGPRADPACRNPITTKVAAQVGNEHAYTRHVFEDDNGEVTAEQWIVDGLGHAWSGGNTAGTYTDDHGPHATSEFVRFFLRFVLHSSPTST